MPLDEIGLSAYGAASSEPSPVNRMMAEFAADFRDGCDVNLGVGYVNERTIPSDKMVETLREVLADPRKYRLPFNYGGPSGSRNLLESLRNYLVTHRVGGITEDVLDRNELIVGPSGATSLLEGVGRLVPPGIVVTSDPMYYIFCDYLERQGFELLAVPEDDDGLRTDILRDRLGELGDRQREISFFYAVTVSNPTCTILSDTRRRELVEIASGLSAEVGRRIPVFLDRAYEDLVHDPDRVPPQSALLYDEAGVVYEIGTLSKILAPALRIGYMIGRKSPFTSAMVQKSSDTGFSAPLVTQEIASRMLDRYVDEQVKSVNREYRRKAAAVAEWIDAFLGDEVADRKGGSAGFYYYLTFRCVETGESSDFFRFLSRRTGDPALDMLEGERAPCVIYLPGSYCVHAAGELVEAGRRQLRLSYGFEELDRIEEALRTMGEAMEWVRNA